MLHYAWYWTHTHCDGFGTGMVYPMLMPWCGYACGSILQGNAGTLCMCECVHILRRCTNESICKRWKPWSIWLTWYQLYMEGGDTLRFFNICEIIWIEWIELPRWQIQKATYFGCGGREMLYIDAWMMQASIENVAVIARRLNLGIKSWKNSACCLAHFSDFSPQVRVSPSKIRQKENIWPNVWKQFAKCLNYGTIWGYS